MGLLNSKKWYKKPCRWVSWSFVSTFSPFISKPVISSVVKGISGRGVRRAGTGHINKFFRSAPSFKQYQDY